MTQAYDIKEVNDLLMNNPEITFPIDHTNVMDSEGNVYTAIQDARGIGLSVIKGPSPFREVIAINTIHSLNSVWEKTKEEEQ